MPQGPVECKGRKLGFGVKTLRQHDLDDIAGQDIFLGFFHHIFKTFLFHVGGKNMFMAPCRTFEKFITQRCFQTGGNIINLPAGQFVSCSKIIALSQFDTVYYEQFLPETVMDEDCPGDHKGTVRKIKPIVEIGELLHEPDHVITQVSDQPSKEPWQMLRRMGIK